jgi:CHRD domain
MSLRMLASLVTVAAFSSAALAAGTVFPVSGSGAQEVPAGDPDGAVSGTVTLDPATNTLSWDLTYVNIAAPSAMHIHSAQDGVNGGVFVGMGVATSGGPGTLVSSMVITPAQTSAILTNPQNHYVNIHNSVFPGGAVRAQLPVVFKVVLRGQQEVAGGDLDGTATGQVWLDTGNDKVGWNISYAGIAAPSAFHIHTGAIGSNGGVSVGLGVVTTGGAGTLINEVATTDALLDPIIANPSGFYLNLHNAEFPGGALRGQVQTTFAVSLDGAQEVGGGDADGTASGTVSFNTRLNTVSWDLTYANIAAPSGFHIHDGDFGSNGPVFVDLGVTTTGGAGTLINTTTTTEAKIDAIFADVPGYYLNLHNAEFPGGAVRGQLELPPPGVFGDLNGDGVVDAADLAILLGAWGTGGPGDLDGNGTVDAADLALLLGAWS